MNEFGSSEASEELVVGVASFPAAPATLAKVADASGTTYITLEWAQSSDTELPVLGYQLLLQDNSLGVDEFITTYDGTNYPNVRKFTVATDVQTGKTYTFKVQAVNFNGAGAASDPMEYTICTAPAVLDPPRLAAVTRTTMTLSWTPPLSGGGCRVLSYSLFMDDGAGGVFSPLDPDEVNDKPTLREHVVTSFTSDDAADDTSKTYRFTLQASNVIGSVESREVAFVLAAVPDQPTSSPTLDLAATSTSRVGVNYASFTTAGTDGGSPVLSYELQMYDYPSSAWATVRGGKGAFTLATSHTQEEGIERGKAYMFRYRAWNINGAGEFSDVSHLVAASRPVRPPRPAYGGSTAASLTLLFRPSSDDRGQMITRMELELSPLLATSWAPVATYDGISMSHVLTIEDDGLTALAKYRFRLRAVNAYGASDYSPELVLTVAPLPGAFDAVTKVQLHSSSTSITVRWAVPGAEAEPILGFRLQMVDEQTKVQSIVYDSPAN